MSACSTCGCPRRRWIRGEWKCLYCGRKWPEQDGDPRMVKIADCDEDGYCVSCWSATVHRDGCIVLEGIELT
jgi:hypothetical protein